MKNTSLNDIAAALSRFESFVIIGHQEPDGDALNSQLALGSFLKRRGKEVFLVSPGPFVRPEIMHKKKYFLDHLPEDISPSLTLAVILDCSTLDRIGYLADEIEGLTTAVIDHHASGNSFGDIVFIDSTAPSVTFLIQQIIEASGESLTPNEADLLFFGLVTDTGFFRHLEKDSGRVFKAAGRLIDAGASPKEAHYQMYGDRTLASRLLLGTLLTKAKALCGGRVITTRETRDDVARFGKINRDSDMLYQLLFSVQGVEVILLFRYEDEGELSVGLRSMRTIDVGSVAKQFGGGGHAKAAGFTWNRSYDEIERSLSRIFCRMLNNSEQDNVDK